MKLKKSTVVAFLVALGFAKATKWDDEKLTDRLAQVPEKVSPDEVPEGQEKVYEQICEAKGKVELENDQPAAKEEAKAEVKKSSKKTSKAVASAPKKNSTPAPKKNHEVKKDAFGCRLGTITARVNAALGKDWVDEETIAETAGVPLTKARDRLYYASEQGLFEHRRLIQYRVATPTKK